MPLQPPDADHRTYAELVEEARSLIPGLDPDWTNHNPTDPGITLVELFAWLCEMLIYRANLVSDDNRATFLKLLHDPATQGPLTGDLDEQIQQAVLALRTRYRAATAADYEYLLLHVWPETTQAAELGAAGRLSRVHCVPRRNLAADPTADAPAHISLVVVPGASSWPGPFSLSGAIQSADLTFQLADQEAGRLAARVAWAGAPMQMTAAIYKWVSTTKEVVVHETGPSPLNLSYRPTEADLSEASAWEISITSQDEALARGTISAQYLVEQLPEGVGAELLTFLDARRLLTTFPKVVSPTYVPVELEVTLVPKADAVPEVVQNEAIDALWTFFDPLDGGPDGTGWPLGRDVYVSEILGLLDQLPGIDYVDDALSLTTSDAARLQRTAAGRVIGITLQPWELVALVANKVTVKGKVLP